VTSTRWIIVTPRHSSFERYARRRVHAHRARDVRRDDHHLETRVARARGDATMRDDDARGWQGG